MIERPVSGIPDVPAMEPVTTGLGPRMFSRGKLLTYREYLAFSMPVGAVEALVRDCFVQVEFTTAPIFRVFTVDDLDKRFDRTARAIHYKTNDETIEGTIRLW